MPRAGPAGSTPTPCRSSPEVSLSAPAGPVASCANCGRAFGGRFCPECGQEATELQRPVAGLVHDFLSDTFAFDARIWRTLPLLVTRPGALAAEYAAGRRARYVPPLRLYVFLGALFFAVMALADGGPLRFEAVTDGDEVLIESAFGIRLTAVGASAADEGSPTAGVSRAAADVEGFNDIVIATLSYAHFFFLPLVALLLWILWRRRWYAEHLVFGMYFFAFALLAGSVMVAAYGLLGNPPPGHPAARAAIVVWDAAVVVMLYRALRDMYRSGHAATAARFLALVPCCFLLASGVVIAIAFLTIGLAY